MTSGFTINSWQELAIAIGIVATISGITGGVIRSWLDRRKATTEQQDRIIRLVETEAEKRVEIVRTEFKLQIAEMQLEHRNQIDNMRNDFEKQIATLKKERDSHRCELAPICSWRNGKIAPPPATA